MTPQSKTIEVVAKTRASLEALADRLGLRNPVKVHIAGPLWTATFINKEEQERVEIERQLKALGY